VRQYKESGLLIPAQEISYQSGYNKSKQNVFEEILHQLILLAANQQWEMT
jgi:hypothetical protein